MNVRRLRGTVFGAAVYYAFSSNLAIGYLPSNYRDRLVLEEVISQQDTADARPKYGINDSLLSREQKEYLDERFSKVRKKYLRTIENAVDSSLAITPEFIAAMIAAESGGNTFAVSSEGAAGLMQLMPGTAKELGLKVFEYPTNNDGVYANQLKQVIIGKTYAEIIKIDERFNPVENIRAGVRYLSGLHDDNIGRILAYNLGPSAFKSRQRGGLNIEKFPREPKQLVQKVHHLSKLE